MFASLLFVIAVLPINFATVGAKNYTSLPRDQEVSKCLLPPYPEHGSYTVSNYPYAMPGQRYPNVKLDISCNIGYITNNTFKSIFCVNGDWSAPIPTCTRDLLGYCSLPTDDLRVEYRCLSFPGTLERSWECESLVSNRTLVRPICRFPGYFSLNVLPEMHCRYGTWDYNPICKPACGLTTQHLQLEGTSTNHLELPWHAAIYKKSSTPYNDYCGGSLISATKIISAAYCFLNYNDELLPVSDFVVAVNKMYRPFNDTRDRNRQLSDVTDIQIPGDVDYYEDNIAIVVVKTPFFFHLSVRPVCLDFDNNLDRTQLTEGNSGKTVGWSKLWSDDDQSSVVLHVFDFPYVKNEYCENLLSTYERPLLTNDKFCTRYNESRDDSTATGTGLAFLESNSQRYYLRGVLSNHFRAADRSTWITMYISIVKHEDFIKEHL